METKEHQKTDPQELIEKLKKLIESLKNKQNSKKDGNELKTPYITQN